MKHDEELLRRCRQATGLGDDIVSDDELMEAMDGTLFLALIKLNIEWCNLKQGIKKAFIDMLKRRN